MVLVCLNNLIISLYTPFPTHCILRPFGSPFTLHRTDTWSFAYCIDCIAWVCGTGLMELHYGIFSASQVAPCWIRLFDILSLHILGFFCFSHSFPSSSVDCLAQDSPSYSPFHCLSFFRTRITLAYLGTREGRIHLAMALWGGLDGDLGAYA